MVGLELIRGPSVAVCSSGAERGEADTELFRRLNGQNLASISYTEVVQGKNKGTQVPG